MYTNKAIIIIGTQGSGKSTYSKRLEEQNLNMKRATKDDIRFMMWNTKRYSECYDSNNSRFGELVDLIHLQVIDTIIKQDLDVIIDETHYDKSVRADLLKYLRNTYPGLHIEAHYIHSSLERCLRRNAVRSPEKVVPESVVCQCYSKLFSSLGGSSDLYEIGTNLTNEGFDRINIINPENL